LGGHGLVVVGTDSIVRDCGATSIVHDIEGRLRQAVINAPSPTATTTRNLLHDGVDLVADYDATDVMMRRCVHVPGVDEPLVIYEGAGTTTKNWQYADHPGSIVATADGTGTSTAIYTYGPFGESSLTPGIRYGYTGQRSMAALGLLYYKARFYSPSLGRFLQPDPIGYADDLNLYAYVGNNPVNFTDPSGLILADAKLLGGKLADVADNLVTGGYGQRASQAVNSGKFGEALLYTGAGMAFGAMNVLTLGQGTVATGVARGAAAETSAMASLSTAELKTIIKENGRVSLLNSKGVFGSGVPGAREALNLTTIPAGLTVEALQAYREIAVRNISAEVQQIRVQVVDKLLGMMGR
jgi:RHS repeat-associated protein